jgi:diguanylate cyclase (GGDEF)-like protein/PAS domain S-box-containing protein
MAIRFHSPALQLFELWSICGGLGAAIATPAFVAIFIARFRSAVNWRSDWIYVVLLGAVTIVGFSQFKFPILFLYYPLLILILMRMGLAWAAIGTLFAAAVGTRLTLAGVGPFAALDAAYPGIAAVRIQAFLAAGMFMAYCVSVVIESQKATERRLQEIVARHALVTENSRDAIVISDFAGQRRYFSPAVENLTGWPAEEFRTNRLRDKVHPEDKPGVERTLSKLRAGLESALIEYRLLKRNGESVWVESNLRVFRDPRTGNRAGTLDFIRDITERKHAEQSREFHHSLIHAIHEVSPAGILVVDDRGNAVSINRQFAEVWKVSTPDTPVSLHETVVASDEQLLAQCVDRTKDPEGFLKRVEELYADPDATDWCLVEMKDGRTLERYTTSLRSEGGQYLGRVWFFTDITDRKRAEEELQAAYRTVEALSAIDTVTGLANRRRFDDYLALEWRRAMREGRPISLLLVDVDHFKSFNDTYGHLSGDACLRRIAQSTLDSVKRAGDLVARFGGDEFTVILTDTGSDGALRVANDICESVRNCKLPHQANAKGVVTASVGCASMTPTPGKDTAALIDLADRALYSAKRAGRDMAFSSIGISQ